MDSLFFILCCILALGFALHCAALFDVFPADYLEGNIKSGGLIPEANSHYKTCDLGTNKSA